MTSTEIKNTVRKAISSFNPSAGEDGRRDVLYQTQEIQFDPGYDSSSFAEQLDKFIAGEKNHGRPLEIGSTPEVLQKVGGQNHKLVMLQSDIKKVFEKHGFTPELLKQIPGQLADPVAVFNSETHPGSLVILTELKNKDGKSIIAAIELDHRTNMITLDNRLASTYGKDHDSVIADWFNDSELPLFVDKEKSLRWFRSRGLSLPKEMNHQGSKYIIENNVEKFKEKLQKREKSVKTPRKLNQDTWNIDDSAEYLIDQAKDSGFIYSGNELDFYSIVGAVAELDNQSIVSEKHVKEALNYLSDDYIKKVTTHSEKELIKKGKSVAQNVYGPGSKPYARLVKVFEKAGLEVLDKKHLTCHFNRVFISATTASTPLILLKLYSNYKLSYFFLL